MMLSIKEYYFFYYYIFNHCVSQENKGILGNGESVFSFDSKEKTFVSESYLNAKKDILIKIQFIQQD
jgi:hypothetical protein